MVQLFPFSTQKNDKLQKLALKKLGFSNFLDPFGRIFSYFDFFDETNERNIYFMEIFSTKIIH